MGKKVTVIPSTRKNEKDSPAKKEGKLRVAAYARVSTDHEDQLGSVENQIEHYAKYIEQNPDYELVKVYHDDGISGTGTKQRTGFQDMIRDCDDGRIDFVITKSISRFARNTEDCLRYSRHLKSIGIGILFEKENINTLDASGELLFTILSSLAQEESRNISENTTWGIRSNFQKGIPHLNTVTLLGYDKDDHDRLIINPEQAETVRRVFREFMEGWTTSEIAHHLNEDGVPGVHNEPRWHPVTIRGMLTNEIYKGDLLMQKTFTPDFLTKKAKRNEGELEQYYVKKNHEAIIEEDYWDAVQEELERREIFRTEHGITKTTCGTDDALYAKVFCGSCGGRMVLKNYTSFRNIYRKCENTEKRNGKICQAAAVPESHVQKAVMIAWNSIIENRASFLEHWKDRQKRGDALERLRAQQMEELTAEGPIENEVPELTRMVIRNILVTDSGIFRITFMDGTEKTVVV